MASGFTKPCAPRLSVWPSITTVRAECSARKALRLLRSAAASAFRSAPPLANSTSPKVTTSPRSVIALSYAGAAVVDAWSFLSVGTRRCRETSSKLSRYEAPRSFDRPLFGSAKTHPVVRELQSGSQRQEARASAGRRFGLVRLAPPAAREIARAMPHTGG
jgi:hypothetical protein